MPINIGDTEIVEFCGNLLNTIQDLNDFDSLDITLKKLNTYSDKAVFLNSVENEFLDISEPWGRYLYNNVLIKWKDDCLSHYPELRTFNSDKYQKNVDQFIDLEENHRKLAREFVKNSHAKKWNGGVGEFNGVALLQKEASKQKKVLAPRKIMEEGALSTMMKLKPCWLMSPLSISQILPNSMGLFDIIIFDEASQVRVEDAIPSIYRANTLIVVGDDQQMPPTNFFISDNLDSDDDSDDAELSTSILDLASQVYPSEILKWHYRSRSHWLIQFSNRAFYGGELISVPDPCDVEDTDAINFTIVENAYFNHEEGNSKEAEAVVDRLIDLLEKNPDKSFGIIAMGQAQKRMIDSVIELRKSQSEKVAKLILCAENHNDSEGNLVEFFVKNLENVQGDERDIILISIGYAPSRPGRKLYQNFGPLSKPGGSKRLNVAITRAKSHLEIFCSFDPNQIKSDEAALSQNSNSCYLARYLQYAQAISNKNKIEVVRILNLFPMGGAATDRKTSNFNKIVQKRLQDIGYDVSTEVGFSRFYIDLGVHHPVVRSKYILGIECDGAVFHSTPYARDRDKLRQQLLEARGWKIARIWSTDWSRDWQKEIKKLDEMLKRIVNS